MSFFIRHGENETSIIITKNAESQAKTKYINIKHYHIHELIINKKLRYNRFVMLVY